MQDFKNRTGTAGWTDLTRNQSLGGVQNNHKIRGYENHNWTGRADLKLGEPMKTILSTLFGGLGTKTFLCILGGIWADPYKNKVEKQRILKKHSSLNADSRERQALVPSTPRHWPLFRCDLLLPLPLFLLVKLIFESMLPDEY